MGLKLFAVVLNVLLLVMFVSYFIGHGLPNNPILWTSATLWLVAPLVNLLYIRKLNGLSFILKPKKKFLMRLMYQSYNRSQGNKSAEMSEPTPWRSLNHKIDQSTGRS